MSNIEELKTINKKLESKCSTLRKLFRNCNFMMGQKRLVDREILIKDFYLNINKIKQNIYFNIYDDSSDEENPYYIDELFYKLYKITKEMHSKMDELGIKYDYEPGTFEFDCNITREYYIIKKLDSYEKFCGEIIKVIEKHKKYDLLKMTTDED